MRGGRRGSESDSAGIASGGAVRPSTAEPDARPGSEGEPPTGSTSADILRLFSRHRLTPVQRRIAQCLTEQGMAAAGARKPFVS